METRRFGVDEFRVFLREALVCKPRQLPTRDECLLLLRRTVRFPKPMWQPTGFRYKDAWGPSSVQNISGFNKRKGLASERVTWNEYGTAFRLRESLSDGLFQVVKVCGNKSVGVSVTRKTLAFTLKRRHQDAFAAAFGREGLPPPTTQPGRPRKALRTRALVFDPLRPLGCCAPRWSFIYLHMFSCKGTGYVDFPHYFGTGDSAVRVVLPTAPLQEQLCFKDWWVQSRSSKKTWSLVKFNSWFNYTTDYGGKGENGLALESLLDCRRLIHNLIREEVQRVGDPRRVILGGASQGGCVALDAAYTYPEELGGVIGIVTHLLNCTELSPAKKDMPVHLFHETNDREMDWGFVQPTVQRMKDSGCNVTSRRESDPCGGGHYISHIEGTWIRRALRELTSPYSSLEKDKK